MGEKGTHPSPPPGRLWECEQRCRCAVEGEPAWSSEEMRETYKLIHRKRRRMRMGIRGMGATRSPQSF